MDIEAGSATPKTVVTEGLASLSVNWPGFDPRWAAGACSTMAADLIVQYRALGLSRFEAAALFRAALAALGTVLAGIDSHAFATSPVPEQVSMLLPRFDVERLAQTTRLSTAQIQSALAMLVLDFVMRAHPLLGDHARPV